MRPFRFGILSSSLPANGWIEWLRRIEGLGYSAIHWPDHFGPQIDPVVAMAAAAGVTQKLRLGSLVCCVDYRHPVVYAKAAASIHALSGGRHEFGIGAGWMEDDYTQAGIPFDKPSVRIERLDEALQII
jgi:alkanesulfonate monooxygenase SsuD/methylene tetrahydromethanopterin reductase-like flavin-dependent oxidoreductase (luciferase family)